ncbi:hypothetical protein [Cytobacillus horneckiae]|nr:hypothetical protein [Cytobacillus horneckiae]
MEGKDGHSFFALGNVSRRTIDNRIFTQYTRNRKKETIGRKT